MNAVVLVLGALGAPLFVVICALALIGFAASGRPPADVTGEMAKLVQSNLLVTIPLFTFAGYVLAESRAPARLVDVSRALFGFLPGGMAVVALITCAFFTTFTGASGVTIVALGGLLLPVLIEQGYPEDFSLGLITTSGSRGLVFPPSVPVIIYGYVAGVDITRLYIAGIAPGLIDVAVVALFCFYVARKSNVPRVPFVGKDALRAVGKALPELALPLFVIAGLARGFVNIAEAAAFTALYVLIVEIVIYRDVHPTRDLPRITRESMILCGAILIILGASLGLTNLLIDKQVPQRVVELIGSSIASKWVFLIALNVFLLGVGCLMDIFSAIVVVVPLLTPLAAKFGIHPIHLAIIFLINLELGYNTPPVGMNLFIASFRFQKPIAKLYRAALAFVLINLVSLLVITYVPQASLFTLKAQSPAKTTTASPDTTKRKSPATPAKQTVDGICSGGKDDPDCDDIKIDDDSDDY